MEPEVSLKTCAEIAGIRRACRLAEQALRYLRAFVRPGVSTLDLDRQAGRCLRAWGAQTALENGFPGTACVSLNEVAVHGVPSAQKILQEGDVLTIDLAVAQEGWCGDAAWSYLVGEGTPESRRLLAAAWKASLEGVAAARAGAHLGDIGAAVQREAERRGYRVVEEFVGHGIGRRMHEEPIIPHVGAPGAGMRIIPGMVFTVEPTLTPGSGQVDRSADGWSILTRDGRPAAQFEHTVAVFRDRTEVLTFSSNLQPCLDFPSFF